ncbi:hypothetical protein C8R44DRAFT_766360 [Mycena epipterygia]|nr:hypothetical protein C8R44DRAFT_766360 [Mycena epipterygia]
MTVCFLSHSPRAAMTRSICRVVPRRLLLLAGAHPFLTMLPAVRVVIFLLDFSSPPLSKFLCITSHLLSRHPADAHD